LVIIRPATENDIGAITDIYAYHVRNGTASFEIDPPDLSEMKRRWLNLVEKNFPYIVAESDGKAIGYAYAGPYRERLAYRYTAENSIYLDKDYAGKGTGQLLLTALLEQCRKLGIQQMIAVIGDSNNTASIRLHTRGGFNDAGILKNVGFKFDRWLDVVLMQREL
jgi:L-amino acid N-acyltransferase YncA